jgi:Fusaric acid resistance protein-like
MEPNPSRWLDPVRSPDTGVWGRGRASLDVRVGRLREKSFQIGQCALAAGLSWFLAADLLGHETPFFAPIAAVVSLGTSYGQRLRRVLEVTLGVAIGVLVADWLVVLIGTGWWQLAVIVALAMATAFLLDGGQLFVIQAAVQAIVVASFVPDPGEALNRWTDALIGGGVALVAATAAPAAPLRRPWEHAARVLRKEADLLRAAGRVMVQVNSSTTVDSSRPSTPRADRTTAGDRPLERALELLADARATDYLIRELHDAADEGLDVVASSPFRVRHRDELRRLSDLVEPLDRSLRSTRVLVRQTAVAAYHHLPVPAAYAGLCDDLAAATDALADFLMRSRTAEDARPSLLELGAVTGRLSRTTELSAEVILAQLRSIVVDLLMVTGLDQFESTNALPRPPHQ